MTSRSTLKIDSRVWWRLPQELRFLLAGAYNTAFGYLTFSLLFILLQTRINYLVIAFVCYPISLTSAFIVHRNLVFRSQERWPRSFIRFNFSQIAAFLFGVAGLYSLVRFGHLAPLVAQALVVIASVLVTYLLHRHFSFRRGIDVGGVP
jgi:putative flippase GtrA